jgi:metallo-beta-lactamase family protein
MGELPRVRSYGAAMTVTGSCHLIDTGHVNVLVDCGAFQGSDALADLNREPFGFDAQAIDAVLLTHAHMDHSSRLPLLVKRGYAGPIYALPATRMLSQYLLLDGAKIQMEDAERDRRRGRIPEEPLFDDADVRRTLELFQPIRYGEQRDVAGLVVTPQRAGHIPGSASFLVEAAGGRLVFSGDLGNARKDVLPDPTPCPPADVVFIESTYGDRDHRDFDATIAELAEVLREAHRRKGKILIPSFALERTQDVLFHIARLEEAREIAPMPVYVDSPLADRVEDVYQACMDEMSDEVRAIAATGRDPFAPARLTYTQSVDESKAINASGEAAIIIAGSGMMTGGRILHHLRAHLDDTHTTVMIVGFQPAGGLGRQLVDRAPEVRIMGHTVRVRARIATIGGLSAHADRTELLVWASGAGPGARFRLVHGEPGALEALRAQLAARGYRPEIQPSEVRLPGHGRRDEGGE